MWNLSYQRITKHQINRPNILSVSIEEYFRISVYNVLYDHVLDDLKDRYLKFNCL